MSCLKVSIILGLILAALTACQGSSQPLQADAGEDFRLPTGQSPTFDGCASTGDIANYKWTIVSAPDTMASDEGKVIRETDPNCSFTLGAAMGVDEVGEWIIELEVRNAANDTSTDTIQVIVEP